MAEEFLRNIEILEQKAKGFVDMYNNLSDSQSPNKAIATANIAHLNSLLKDIIQQIDNLNQSKKIFH